MTIDAALERPPASKASAKLRSLLGKIPGSRYASAIGVAEKPPRAKIGTKPAARTISIGTDGHAMATPRPFASIAAALTDSLNAAVSISIGRIVMASDDPLGAQLFDYFC